MTLFVPDADPQQPGRRAAAPSPLRLVQDFLNTTDLEDGVDALSDPDALRAWLARHSLPGGDAPLDRADLDRVLTVREAFRALLLANNGGAPNADAVATLNDVSREARLAVRFAPTGDASLLPACSGIHTALGTLLAIVSTATVDGTWARLKACERDVCRWAFYDASKNRSGHWCSMAVCGNRRKASAYRRRRAAGMS